MHQFKMLNGFLHASEIVFAAAGGSTDWIGCGSEYWHTSWIGFDWISELVDWVGSDLAKWTHVRLCGSHPALCCIHRMNQVNSRNALSMMTVP